MFVVIVAEVIFERGKNVLNTEAYLTFVKEGYKLEMKTTAVKNFDFKNASSKAGEI